MSTGRFRCIHCGDYFNLPRDEMQDYEEGYFDQEPDTCSDCLRMYNGACEPYPTDAFGNCFSDADPGL